LQGRGEPGAGPSLEAFSADSSPTDNMPAGSQDCRTTARGSMTMKSQASRLAASLVIGISLAAAPAWAACTYPKGPDKIPDGNSATLDEMLAAQKAVKQFDADVGAYQTCLETELNEGLAAAPTLTEDQKKERQKIVVQKQNAAAEEVTAVANRLNEQIRVYREKNKKS
jgi:hypothetical protein